MEINKIIDRYFELQQQIFNHVGYIEDWAVIPLNDLRNFYWEVDPEEKEWIQYAEQAELLPSQTDSNDLDGDYYEEDIYTQRFLPKWVYRGEKITIICSDPHADGNKFLHIFDNDKEIKNV